MRMAAGWVDHVAILLPAYQVQIDTGKPCIDRARAAAASGSADRHGQRHERDGRQVGSSPPWPPSERTNRRIRLFAPRAWNRAIYREKARTAALYFIPNPSVCYRASPNLAQWEKNAIPSTTPATLLLRHCCDTVAERERVGEREKGRGRGIKYRIVGIEYGIEIT